MQNRRDFLRTWTVLVATAVLATCALADAHKPNRPSLVVILVDDLGIDSIGCYGADPPYKTATPNIDWLAAGGIRFERCYNIRNGPNEEPEIPRDTASAEAKAARTKLEKAAAGLPPVRTDLNSLARRTGTKGDDK